MGEHAAYGCDGLSFLVGKELCLELFFFLPQFGAVWDSGGDEVWRGWGELERVR